MSAGMLASPTHAASAVEIKIGVVLSSSGPAASLGIPARNTVALLPQTLSNTALRYIVLDDASDSGKSAQSARKLIDEEKVDAIIGTSITPTSASMIEPVAHSGTPMISLAAGVTLIAPVDEKRRWVFKVTPSDALMAAPIAQHIAQQKMRTVGFIGFADSYGENWQNEFSAAAQKNNLRLVAAERYNRADVSVTAQILKLLAAQPDAILIGASGTQAALPARVLKERGYRGAIYQTPGVANSDFLRVCAQDCEGEWLSAGPLLVVDQLPENSPVKSSARVYRDAYEKIYGTGSVSSFGGYAWDAGQILARAIPIALKKAAPGSAAFRLALRDAIEASQEVPAANGIFNFSATRHDGLDARALLMLRITDGKWQYVAP